MLVRIMYLIVLTVLVVVMGASQACASNLPRTVQRHLALRFRPYIKTTLEDGAKPEPFHPCDWQWFIRHCTMVKHYFPFSDDFCPTGIDDEWPDGVPVRSATDLGEPGALITPECADVRHCTVADSAYALHLDETQFHAGESWSDVVHMGHGIYAHVVAVPSTSVVNIEYIILWPYNASLCNFHNGDLTTLVVVYDAGCDRLTRVTYLPHGQVTDSFRIAQPGTMSLASLPGREADNSTPLTMPALACELAGTDQWQDGDDHSPSTPVVYLALDPESGRYEHPVVYAEHAAHELWPNPTGDVTTAPGHEGDGFAFLPDSVQVLGGLESDDLNPAHEAFLFYNGKFGTDPQAVILHRSWYWPTANGRNGRVGNGFGLLEKRFSDRDPYKQNGPFAWPPSSEFTSGPVTVFVGHGPVHFDGTESAPFPGIGSAMSMVPSGGVVAIAAGGYAGAHRLERACRVVTRGGVVKIGAP